MGLASRQAGLQGLPHVALGKPDLGWNPLSSTALLPCHTLLPLPLQMSWAVLPHPTIVTESPPQPLRPGNISQVRELRASPQEDVTVQGPPMALSILEGQRVCGKGLTQQTLYAEVPIGRPPYCNTICFCAILTPRELSYHVCCRSVTSCATTLHVPS